jgi:ubiquitin
VCTFFELRPFFLASRPFFSVYAATVTGMSLFCVQFYVGMAHLHFKLPYVVYGTNCTPTIYFIFSACFSSFFHFARLFHNIKSFTMAVTQKPPSTKAKRGRAPSAKATASCVRLQAVKLPKNNSTLSKHTPSSKSSIVATMATSTSSDSSISSIDGRDYASPPDVSDFVPTALPTGPGTISSDALASFQATLDITSTINFTTLSNDKSIEWNVCLSKSCRRLSDEYSILQKHIFSLKSSSVEMNKTTQRQSFANEMLPLIKKRSHDLFLKLAFPSMIEVTTTNGKALSTFGLTSTSPLARMVFDEFVFKPQGSSLADPISPEDTSFPTPRHHYDTPDIRDDLWVNHGIGTFSVKELGRVRNTFTNICRDVLRK